MGLNEVHDFLRDMFPQVDSRVLKAVAIEHAKDADVAVEVVLSDVMPFFNIQVDRQASSDKAQSLRNSSKVAVEAADNDDLVSGLKLVAVPSTPIAVIEEAKPNGSSINPVEKDTSYCEKADCKNGCVEKTKVLHEKAILNVENQVPSLPVTDVEEQGSNDSLNGLVEKGLSSCEMVDCKNESDVNTEVFSKTQTFEVGNLEQSDCEQHLSTSEIEGLDEVNTLSATVGARSFQICRTEFLEDIIENARSEKIALRSSKDSLISLMKEVELKENSVDQAKEEAARGGLHMLARVNDLKQMLERAKEANDMHSGEIYGERAILATEMKELQSRLLSLSDETAKALTILDEIRQSVEVRLAVAEKKIETAEKERLEKEESARKSFAYEESIMDKVVQESKILKQEAEENSKLSEFLMHRGQSVDMLQGEISVLYQDIKLMKEKFDQRLPLSKFLALSQTNSLLATSSLSSASTTAERVPELAEASKNSTPISASSSDDRLSCGEDAPSHRKELVEDGWEFFDKHECSM